MGDFFEAIATIVFWIVAAILIVVAIVIAYVLTGTCLALYYALHPNPGYENYLPGSNFE